MRQEAKQFTCSKCKIVKARTEYHVYKGKRNTRCKRCRLDLWNQYNRSTGWTTQTRWKNNLRKEVLSHYSGGTPSCKCCNETHYEFLTLDHINEDGAEQKRKLFGNRTSSYQMYNWVKKNGYPGGYQVLCYNCNCAKHHFGVCPHTKMRDISPITEKELITA